MVVFLANLSSSYCVVTMEVTTATNNPVAVTVTVSSL